MFGGDRRRAGRHVCPGKLCVSANRRPCRHKCSPSFERRTQRTLEAVCWGVVACRGQLVLTAGLHNHHGEWKQASGKYCKDCDVGISEAPTMLGSPAGRMGRLHQLKLCAHGREHLSEVACWDEVESCISSRGCSIGHLIFLTHDPLASRMHIIRSPWWYPGSTAQEIGRGQDQAGGVTHMQNRCALRMLTDCA